MVIMKRFSAGESGMGCGLINSPGCETGRAENKMRQVIKFFKCNGFTKKEMFYNQTVNRLSTNCYKKQFSHHFLTYRSYLGNPEAIMS